jgi:cell wall-associated NlpC family hydrolase
VPRQIRNFCLVALACVVLGASSHVAIYLGGGQIIESGGSGHNVHVGAIWGHPSGAARVLA